MDFNTYAHRAIQYAQYENELYPFFALAEETGEFLGKIAKECRGDRVIGKDEKLKELGDILWQLNACCIQLDSSLGEVAKMNLDKLADRANRNVIKGNGDER